MLRGHWLTVVGLVVAVVGCLVLVLVRARTEQFGWTSYAPLHSGPPTPPSFLVFDRQQALLGLLLLAAGVGITAGRLGYLMGHRHTSATSTDEVS